MQWRLAHWFLPLAIAGRALADNPDTARELFDDARRLMNEGDYQTASKRLEEALLKQNGRGIKYQLAVCYEKLGRTASARILYQQVANESHQMGELDREQVARGHAEQLDARVGHLKIVVSEPAPSMSVRRDDATVGGNAWGVTLAIDPGEHAIRADAPNRTPWQTKIVVAEGEEKVVEVPPLAVIAVQQPVVPLPGPIEHAPQPSSKGPWRAPALALGGVGLATIATGFVITAVSAATYGASSQYCASNDHCMARGVSLRSDALTYGDVATGLLVGGAITVAAAAIVWLWNPKPARAAVALSF